MNQLISRSLLAAGAWLLATAASAGTITYSLSDKAPGAENPPDYGIRVDGLFGDASSVWTWSFNMTDVKMVIDTVAETAHIFGNVIGGKDVGQIWNPAGGELWYLDFEYTDITITDAATGLWHAADVGGDHVNPLNSGTLQKLEGNGAGGYLGLRDFKGGDFYMDASKGPYVSAWLASTSDLFADPASIQDGDYNRIGACCKDFGFKATPVPEPTPLMLLGSMLLAFSFARRLKSTTG